MLGAFGRRAVATLVIAASSAAMLAVTVASAEAQSRKKKNPRQLTITQRSFLDSGQLRSEVFGEQARHFPDSDTLEIDKVRALDRHKRIARDGDLGPLVAGELHKALAVLAAVLQQGFRPGAQRQRAFELA